MTLPVLIPDHMLVSCEVCLQELPRERAMFEEVDDYVIYFCGLDCYRVWCETNAGNDTEPGGRN